MQGGLLCAVLAQAELKALPVDSEHEPLRLRGELQLTCVNDVLIGAQVDVSDSILQPAQCAAIVCVRCARAEDAHRPRPRTAQWSAIR